MERKLTLAAVQMDVQPAPTAQRLARAYRLVATAAQAGAQLVVLPELFNTGYAYTDENYARAEAIDGLTVTWLHTAARRLKVHLAGSLLVRERGDIYNALLLVAPDGRSWRYNKNHPFAWERAYFRSGKGTLVAHTDLGDIGLLVCVDVTQRRLWRAYAGQVDLILVASSPPDVGGPVYCFPDGRQATLSTLGQPMATLQGSARLAFEAMLNQQTAWLGVPAVNSVACGEFRSNLPNARLTLLSLLPAAPAMARYLPQAAEMELVCRMVPACKIVDASGCTVAGLGPEQGEGFVCATVGLSSVKPQPQGPQPPSPIPRLAGPVMDLIARLSVVQYELHVRKQ